MRSYVKFREALVEIFKRDDVRGVWGAELDAEIAHYLGRAFARILKAPKPHLIVGRDMRQGSPPLAMQIAKGIEAEGGTVHDLGMCGSEMVYYATGARPKRYQGGAMVTASHNPPEYAGAKFVKAGAEPLSADELTKLKEEAARLYAVDLRRALRGPERSDLTTGFIDKLTEVAGLSKQRKKVGLKIVVQAGNGMGGVTFAPVAERLEQLLPGTRCLPVDDTPDGTFPICTPDPLSDEYLDLLSDRVREEKADLGLCFDGDADRAGFVDDRGNRIDASLVSLVLYEALKPRFPNREYVMGNLNSSLRFTDFVAARGGMFVMTPVGHAKIKGLMRVAPYFRRTSRVLFASEHSGHYFYPDFFYADSGMTTALFMIRKAREAGAAGSKLSTALREWRRGFFASGEINVKVKTDEQAEARIRAIADEYQPKGERRGIVKGRVRGTHEVKVFDSKTGYDTGKLEALDLRVDSLQGKSPRWWVTIRKSGNEPELRLNVEAESKAKMEELRDELQIKMRGSDKSSS